MATDQGVGRSNRLTHVTDTAPGDFPGAVLVFADLYLMIFWIFPDRRNSERKRGDFEIHPLLVSQISFRSQAAAWGSEIHYSNALICDTYFYRSHTSRLKEPCADNTGKVRLKNILIYLCNQMNISWNKHPCNESFACYAFYNLAG